MRRQKVLSLVRSILEQPTAPFHEEHVARRIQEHLARLKHVAVREDHFGNLIAKYSRGRKAPRHAFAVHMDHPGWVGGKFLGGVPAGFLKNPQTREFGEFAMWDLPACELRDGLIHSRACDDLIGCAVLVAMLHELEEAAANCSCVAIFSRAEEVGFIGAIKLAESGELPKSLTVVSVETSAERLPAKIGDGPIVRVGDRTSIFDSCATAELMQLATESKIPVQRCLMPGGTCEATAYQLHGYRSVALCVALGNYHNCGPNGKIASEFVSLSDVQNLVRLCVRIAAFRGTLDPDSALRKKLAANMRKYRPHFDPRPGWKT